MNILVLVPAFGKEGAATNRLWTELSEHFSQRNQVTVIVPDNGVDAGEVGNRSLHLIRVPNVCKRLFANRHLHEVGQWIGLAWKCLTIQDRFDIVVCVDTPRMLSIAAYPRKLRDKAQVIMWVLDLPLEQVVRRQGLKAWQRHIARLANWLYYRSLALCDRVVVIGTCMKDLMRDRAVNEDRMSQIGVWVDNPESESMVGPAAARAGQEMVDQFTVVYCGYAGAWHNFETIIGALEFLAPNYPIQFIFAGMGPGIERVTESVRLHGWDNVHVLGWLPRRQLGAVPSCAELHLVSLKEEMLGTCVPSKTYGALAFGRPVVFIGPKGSQAAIDILDANAGIAVQTKEQLIEAVLDYYSDRDELKRASANARIAFERSHCAAVCLAKWDAMLQEMKKYRKHE